MNEGISGDVPETTAQQTYFQKLGLLFPEGAQCSPMMSKSKQGNKKSKAVSVVEPTLHLKTTTQQLNYKTAQKAHHSVKHRKTSMVGSMQYRADSGGGDTAVSAAALDAVCRGRPMGDTYNLKHARVALAQKLALRLKTQKHKLNTLFREFDTNHNGSLELNEFINVLELFCPGELRAKDARSLMKLLDKNNDGEVSLDEFTGFVESYSKESKENGAGEWELSKPSEWKTSKTFSRHRGSLTGEEQVANHLTLTRSLQAKRQDAKQRHADRNKKSKAATYGGFLDHLVNVNQAPLLSSDAGDSAKKGKSMGKVTSQRQNLDNTINKLHLAMRSRRKEARKIFARFDANDNGVLDPEEFQKMLQHFCPGQISMGESRRVIQRMDVNNDGSVNWVEFESFINAYVNDSKVERTKVAHQTPPPCSLSNSALFLNPHFQSS
jgi:Ca2+-binding EF-hand superfamily protein